MALRSGHRVTIEGHPDLEHSEQLIVRIRHRYDVVDAEDVVYRNDFEAIPADRTFRPPRTTPKPKMAGFFTGLIEPDDSEVIGESAVLDAEGRYSVRLLFDIQPRDARSSKFIRMAKPHGGAGHGMHFPLRPGVEVAVIFANGDPDRPVIAGAIPNPVTPTPTISKNSRHNILSTASGIRLTMRDTK